MSDSNIASFPSYEREWLKLLDDGFIGNAVACISAYRALADDEEKEYHAVKNGNRWQMPIDFVPIGTKLKPTADDKTPLEDRKNHIACLHRGDDGACNSAISGISLDDFSRKLQQLRLGAHKWGISKIEAILVTGLNTDHPDLQVNGHAISSTNDFFAWLKKGLWSKEKQVVVAFASNDVWGQNNQWAINLEKEFCNMLAVTWSDAKSNGDRMVKPPQGKCFHNIFVKAKGSLCTRIRNNCKRVFRVAVYCRNEGDDAEDEGTIKSVVESNKSRKSKVPKLVAQEVACIDKDGFTGNLGYCEGHPYLDELLTKLGKVKTEVTPAPKSVALSKDDASTITSPLTVSVSSSKEKAGPSDLEMFLMSQGIQSVDDIKKLLGASATESAASLTVDRTAERPTMVMTPEKASVASPKSSEKASSKTKTLAVKTRAKRGASDMADNPLTPGIDISPIASKWQCEHDYEFLLYHTNDQRYFSPGYLSTHPLWPHKCVSCDKKFVGKPLKIPIEEDEYRVTADNAAYLCRNAQNSFHTCLFAHCGPCHTENRPPGGTPKKKRVRKKPHDA